MIRRIRWWLADRLMDLAVLVAGKAVGDTPPHRDWFETNVM